MRCRHRARRPAPPLTPCALLPRVALLLGPAAAATAAAPTRTAHRGISAVELAGREDAGETDDLNAQADDAGHVGGAESLRVVATGVSNFPWRLRVRERVDTASGHADIKAKVSCGRQHLPLQALGYDGDSGTVDSDQGTDLVQDVLRLLRSETPARVREPPVVGARQAANHALAACQEVAHPALGRQAREVHEFVEEDISGHRRQHRKSEKSSRRRRPAQPREPELRPRLPPLGNGSAQGGQAGPPHLAPLGFWLFLSFGCGGVAVGVLGKVRRRRRRIREAVELSVIAGIPFEAPNLIEFNGLDSLALAEKDILERFDRQLRKLIAHKDAWHDASL